jgi:hypothetical protein
MRDYGANERGMQGMYMSAEGGRSHTFLPWISEKKAPHDSVQEIHEQGMQEGHSLNGQGVMYMADLVCFGAADPLYSAGVLQGIAASTPQGVIEVPAVWYHAARVVSRTLAQTDASDKDERSFMETQRLALERLCQVRERFPNILERRESRHDPRFG